MSEINIREVLDKKNIDMSEKRFSCKDELFRYMANIFHKNGYVADVDGYIKALYEREAMGSTYMCNHLVLPHGKTDSVVKTGVAICRFEPMKYDDSNENAQVAVMMAIPQQVSGPEYLRLLANISTSLLDEKIFKMLFEEDNPEVIVDALEAKETGH